MSFDTFMAFKTGGKPEIKGETTDATIGTAMTGLNTPFEIYSFSWGASNPVTIGSGTTGTGGGKVSISSFNIMKKSDSASPVLFTACASGSHQAAASVVMRKAGGTQVAFLRYDFTEVFVESIQWSGSSGGDDTPTESVSFAFKSVTIHYFPQKVDGTQGTMIPASWDVTLNTPAAS